MSKSDKGGDNEIELTVVVSGKPTTVDANLSAPLRTVAEKALEQTDQTERDLTRWEMTTAAGDQLDFDTKVADAGLTNEDTVVLNLRTGVTG